MCQPICSIIQAFIHERQFGAGKGGWGADLKLFASFPDKEHVGALTSAFLIG